MIVSPVPFEPARFSPVEEWRISVRPYLEVSNLGNVRTKWRRSTPKPMKAQITLGGYRAIHIRNPDGTRRSITVAILVALAFIGPRPEGMVVAHENGIKTDDRLVNLSYKTQLENIHDKFRHGTVMMAEGHSNHKLTCDAVREIRKSRKFIHVLATEYGVSRNAIFQVKKGITWKSVL